MRETDFETLTTFLKFMKKTQSSVKYFVERNKNFL